MLRMVLITSDRYSLVAFVVSKPNEPWMPMEILQNAPTRRQQVSLSFLRVEF
jgi:hypothetical protein